MKIILELMTFFFSILLFLSITLFILDKFFKKDSTVEGTENLRAENEKRMEVGFPAEKSEVRL